MANWSASTTVTEYSDLVFADLMTTVKAHLAASTKRLISIEYFGAGVVAITFYAIIHEE